MTPDVLLADVVQERDLNEIEARRLVDGMRADVADLGERIATAYIGRAWLALGHPSWDALCDVEFDGARLRIPREQRVEQVQSLRSAGLSTRAIGSALGVGDATVRRDLSTAPDDAVEQPTTVQSLDGRTRPASQPPRPQPSPPVVSEPAGTTGPTAPAGGEPDVPDLTGVALTREHFLAQRRTGAVVAPPDEPTVQQAADDDLAAHMAETDARYLVNLFRAITSVNAGLLDLDAQRAVDTCRDLPDERDSLLAFLARVQTWSDHVRTGLRPALRSVR